MATSAAPADLGARLNAARLRAGLGMSEVAEICDLSVGHLRDVMAGKRIPNGVITRRLIETLELDDETADLLLAESGGVYVSSGGFGSIMFGDFGDTADRP